MKILVTGGSGFIGSAYIRHIISTTDNKILNFDNLTYSSNQGSLANIASSDNYEFFKGDITNQEQASYVLDKFKPNLLVNFAAESHVDKSIEDPSSFMNTNILGVSNLLNCSLEYSKNVIDFRFHHLSTDEVYGDINKDLPAPKEDSPFYTNSPYSASKASSDLIVRAWNQTYGLPTLVTNCTNNYGPYQYPEKLIPLMILKAIRKEPLPIYGDGMQERDWLFVEDHVGALALFLEHEFKGDRYNISADNQITNLEVVNTICDLLSKTNHEFLDSGFDYSSLITFVEDRPGHDKRYALDSENFRKKFSWTPETKFEYGIGHTVKWYLENITWWEDLLSKSSPLERIGLRK